MDTKSECLPALLLSIIVVTCVGCQPAKAPSAENTASSKTAKPRPGGADSKRQLEFDKSSFASQPVAVRIELIGGQTGQMLAEEIAGSAVAHERTDEKFAAAGGLGPWLFDQCYGPVVQAAQRAPETTPDQKSIAAVRTVGLITHSIMVENTGYSSEWSQDFTRDRRGNEEPLHRFDAENTWGVALEGPRVAGGPNDDVGRWIYSARFLRSPDAFLVIRSSTRDLDTRTYYRGPQRDPVKVQRVAVASKATLIRSRDLAVLWSQTWSHTPNWDTSLEGYRTNQEVTHHAGDYGQITENLRRTLQRLHIIDKLSEPADAELEMKACGPPGKDPKYTVQADEIQHPLAEAPAGKALMYVIHSDLNHHAQVKFAVDGEWKGVNIASTYFFVVLDPGQHYFCSQAEARAFRSLRVEAGKIYFLHQLCTPTMDGVPKPRNRLEIGKSLDVDGFRIAMASTRKMIDSDKGGTIDNGDVYDLLFRGPSYWRLKLSTWRIE